jgi:hypothetical protein
VSENRVQQSNGGDGHGGRERRKDVIPLLNIEPDNNVNLRSNDVQCQLASDCVGTFVPRDRRL